jgi:hypothetical protein
VSEVIEQLIGRGKVLLGERQVATAQYAIMVTQDFIGTSSYEGRSRVPGMKSANGQLQVTGGAKDLELAVEWTLILDDGRRCHCVASGTHRVGTGSHSFVVSGEIR